MCEAYDGPPQWPTWLKVVAARVDELLAYPFVSERFLAMVREWATQLAKRGPTGDSPDRFHLYGDCAVEILPTRHMSLVEKYALLAAVHHEVAPEAPEHPRKIELDVFDASSDPAEGLICVSYNVLCSQVHELGDRDERIEQALREVEQDLRDAGWQGQGNEAQTDAGGSTPIGAGASEKSMSGAGGKVLPKWMDAKAIADEYGWSPSRVRSELTKAYYGPGGAGVGKPASGKARWRVNVPNAGGSQPQYLWNTMLVIPHLKLIFEKH